MLDLARHLAQHATRSVQTGTATTARSKAAMLTRWTRTAASSGELRQNRHAPTNLGRALPRRTRRRVPLPRARGGRDRSPNGSELFEKLAVSRTATPSAGRSCLRESGRPLPATRPRRARGCSPGSAKHFGTGARAAADAGGRRPRGAGVPRHGAALEQSADAPGGGRHRVRFRGPRAGARPR